MNPQTSFSEKTAIITGTARGIGRACAEIFTENGATVIGADIRDQSKTVESCENCSGTFEPVHADVTDNEEVDGIIEAAIATGSVDILVNVAGVVNRDPLESYTDEDWDKSLAINLTGPFRLARAAVPELKKNSGSIVNISSIYGHVGRNNRSSYASSKAGLDGLTRAWAAELGPAGIRVNSVSPGFIRTPMTEPYMNDEEALNSFLEQTPLRRLGEPSDVASVVAFVASDAASYVSGETILVDGGRASSE